MTVRSNIRPNANRGGQNIGVSADAGGSTVGVTTREEAAPVVVESAAPASDGAGYGYGGGDGYQGDSYQAGDVSYDLGQAVAGDTVSLVAQSQGAPLEQPAQRQPSSEIGRAPSSEQIATRNAAASGMRAQAMTPQERASQIDARIPMIDVSSIGPMEAMSSRRDRFDDDMRNWVHEGLAESGAEIGMSRVMERGAMAGSVPSSDAMDARDEQIVRERRSKTQVTEDANGEAVTRPIERPDSIFNRPFGYNPKSRAVKTRQPSISRFSDAIKAAKNRAKDLFKNAGRGYRIYGKMNGLPSLGFREVGVGLQEIAAVVSQNPEMLDKLLGMRDGESVSIMTLSEIADLINSGEVYVATFKPPSNRGQDVQRRILRVLTNQQRGIYLHPVMAAMYTADFDGDDMEVSLDPNVAELADDPMEGMVGIDGKQSLNTDFLRVAKLVDGWSEEKTARDYVREIMLHGIQLDGRQIRQFVDSVVFLGDQADKGGDEQAVAWSRVFREARKVAEALTDNRTDGNSLMSTLCERVYRGMDFLALQGDLSSGEIVRPENMPNPRTYDDEAVYKLVDGMVQGKIPNNFQDLKIMLTGFTGNVKGKNAPFRFTADVGKMMKMDSRLMVGDEFEVDPNNKEHMKAFFESTVKFAYSQAMAREIKKAGRSQYYTKMLSEMVIREVGFPDSIVNGKPLYSSYQEFLMAFCESYNRNSAMVNEANLVMLSSGEISSDSNRGVVSPFKKSLNMVTLGDVAEPMLSIYGTFSVRRMFGVLETSGITRESIDDRWKGLPGHTTNLRKGGGDVSKAYEREYEASSNEFWITNKYMSYSLRKFAHENRLIRNADFVSRIRSSTVSSLKDIPDTSAQFGMLMAIADKGTGAQSKFNKSVYGANGEYDGTTVQMMSEVLTEMKRLDTDGTVSGRRDQMRWVEDSISTLYMSGPDMFSYFNMDSPAGFLQSKWARKMIEYAGNFDVIGGIRAAMVFDYRMERITALSDSIPDPNIDMDQYMDASNNLQFAKDELAASSEVWHGIIREMEAEETPGMTSAFSQMASGTKLSQTSISGEVYEWNPTYDAAKFWASDNGRHTTLRSVIEDLDLGWETKRDVITDVIRYWEQDFYLKSYEVGFQLEIGNDSTYSLNSGATKGALTVHRDFEKAFNRWGKTSQEKMQENIDKASERHRSKRGNLIKTLERLDRSPWELIEIDDHMYADSILSVLDKTYAQTEKASQHPWTNAIYSALSFQRNGGFDNDVHRTNDRLLGLTSVDKIGVQDIIHILANPDAIMWVYNDVGEIGLITRDIILMNGLRKNELSADIESDIWEFLEQEPAIASAIRRHNACVKSDSDGSGYIGASLSTMETIDRSVNGAPSPIDHVKYLMRDHPIYASIISLATPARGAVTRNARERIVATEDYLCRQLYAYASDVEANSTQAAMEILADLGVTKDALREVLRSDYDKYLDILRIAKVPGSEVESNEDADYLYEVASSSVAKYIDDIRQSVKLGVHDRSEGRSGNQKTISQFRGEHDFLSNFYMTNVTIDGITYQNAEAAFQAQKTVDPSDRVRFANLTGKQARELGRKIELRSDWESVKEDVMRRVIKAKFSDPALRKKLTDTGDARLIEGNTWGDTTWGTVNGKGLNLLGNILMDERGIKPASSGRPSHLGIDLASVASFWDVLQELSGAKTLVSTGVEGAETYQFGEWASHISSQDAYADLEAVLDDVDQSWDGVWTNLIDDGAPVFLSVDGEGNPSVTIGGRVITDMSEARDLCNLDEIVVQVPSGYSVQDKSTDSHGTPVSSLSAYMVCKRSKGAEEFNLKTKKCGLDGLDSITKMQGKYKMIKNEDGTSSPVDFLRIRAELQYIAQKNGENGLMAAKLKLAQMMLEENMELGYDDLTLSNYMSIADLMLVVGEDGNLYLRSLEMLFSAIKNRLGTSIDEMTDDEIRNAADSIVNDVSENGVGIARMSSLDAFDKFRPMSKASQVSGIRQNSSVFMRNYDLLDAIGLDAFNNGIDPLATNVVTQLHEEAMGIKEIKDMVNASSVTRSYNIVGYAGMFSVNDSINWNVGPTSAILIGNRQMSDADVENICEMAYSLGMTVIVGVENRDKIPQSMIKDCMPCNDSGDVLIPCFDMRLNGCESAPYNGGRFAIFQAPYSRYVVSVEDSTNEFQLGDAQYKPTRALADRMKVVDSGSVSVNAEELFPNVFRNPDFRHCDFTVTLASQSEIAQQIANGVTCTIDYGVVEGGKGFDQRVRDVGWAIERYQSRWGETNPDGMLMGDMVECEPGDIVAWAEVEIHDQLTDQRSYVLAPIIPFPLHGSTKNVPEKFSVQDVVSVQGDNTVWAVNWTNTSEIANSNAKYFDSSGGANKGMIDFTDVIEDLLVLKDGTRVDAYCAKASTDSRKIGTDKRIKTMISLMALSRMHGYNFAKSEGAFPQSADHPENEYIRENMPHKRFRSSEWKAWLANGDMLFSNDVKVNAFLNYECRKILKNEGNPSDYLANVFEGSDGVEHNTHVMWEFEAMFEQGLNYEDGLLRFLHAMDPQLCPNGVDDANEYTFRLKRDGDGLAKGYDSGVLQMQVPHRLASGSMSYLWDNVYIGMSFFGEDYSGFSRPNVDGASNFLDAMNTASYYGAQLDERQARFRALWATAGIGRQPHDGGALGKA